MAPPLLQVNNFLQPNAKDGKAKNIQIDMTSKIYILLGLILGVNRITIINSSKRLFLLMIFYYVLIHATLFYRCFISLEYLSVFDASTTFMFTTLGGLFTTRLLNFHDELNKLDDEIGFNMKNSKDTKYNIWFFFATTALSLLFYGTKPDEGIRSDFFYLVPYLLILLQALELHYYGHLFSLVIPRLKLITKYFNLSYPNPHQDRADDISSQDLNNLKKQLEYSYIDLQKLTTFYDKIIIIYDKLNSAIKWQMVHLLTTTFIHTLVISYLVLKVFVIAMNTNTIGFVDVTFLFLSLAMKLVHILVPCVFADKVYNEAFTLREILACRLYENTLDKSSRSSARTLLALIETRDLSFSLFHMINVDMSLVFKFLGLLLTYLVILLQFDKVINP